jgi:hypothetical protein
MVIPIGKHVVKKVGNKSGRDHTDANGVDAIILGITSLPQKVTLLTRKTRSLANVSTARRDKRGRYERGRQQQRQQGYDHEAVQDSQERVCDSVVKNGR